VRALGLWVVGGERGEKEGLRVGVFRATWPGGRASTSHTRDPWAVQYESQRVCVWIGYMCGYICVCVRACVDRWSVEPGIIIVHTGVGVWGGGGVAKREEPCSCQSQGQPASQFSECYGD